jgi:two-component system phosphate regulon sensor histidine kinase PhoR
MSVASSLAIVLLLLALVVYLGVALTTQIRQRSALLDWLKAPEKHDIPEGVGNWRNVFSGLQRLRKEAQKERDTLENILKTFRLAAQALPDGVILLDAQGHIEWLNKAACAHFGLDAERDLGTMIGQLLRQKEFHAYVAAFRAGTADAPVPLKIWQGAEERAVTVTLLAYAESKSLLVSHDVTELVRTETVRRDFIANVSHELRTPLTVISGFLEQFNSGEPPAGETARHILGLMAEQSVRMNRLVEDLLTLSRLESDNQPPRDDEVDIPRLLASLLEEAQILAKEGQIITLASVASARVRGNADELRSAFGNLVSNAVRYTPAGGTITLSWCDDEAGLTFVVADTGIGIAAEHLPRLTERFYRIDKGRSTALGGTGLGLAIVKHVLMRHGGTLTIDSTIGKGSRFTARLPRQRRID